MMLRILSILALFISLSATSTPAQKRSAAVPLEVDSVHRPFDVNSYDVALDWRALFQQAGHNYFFTGVNTIVLTGTGTADEILLDASAMHIDQIVVNGARLSADVQPDANAQLHIPLSISPGQHYQLEISYTHSSPDIQGLYYYPKDTYVGQGPAGDSVFTIEDLAYTMSEPLDAHKWMPCMDRPYDKATSRISIRVPDGFSAQSNGLLAMIDTNSDGSLTFHWVNDTPISTYLMVADASRFVEWTTWYTRVSDTTQKVPVYNYAWQADYDQTEDRSGMKYNAQWALRNTPDMMAVFSKRFGEYPFVKYGMVPVQPFSFGGMEHQTLTTINRSWLRGWSEDGIAHELMHQWFGDKTTCATWSDIWLNEGFASYGEAIWEEGARGTEGYLNVIKSQAAAFFNPRPWEVNDIPIYDPPLDNIFNYPTTYAKGSCVLHMLRRALADDTLFFNTLRDYSSTFAFSTAMTEQFRDYIARRIGDRSPINVRNYINLWIFRGGTPTYAITWASGDNGVLVIKVDQTQSGTPYPMALRFASLGIGIDTVNVMVADSEHSQIFKVKLGRQTRNLVFDTSAAILSQFTLQYDASLEALSVPTRAETAVKLSRTTSGWRLTFAASAEAASVEVTDVLGRVVLSEPVAFGANALEIASNGLPHGVFWGRLRVGDSASSFRIEN